MAFIVDRHSLFLSLQVIQLQLKTSVTAVPAADQLSLNSHQKDKYRADVYLRVIRVGVGASVTAGLLSSFQLSATQKDRQLALKLCVPMNYTWFPLRHLTAGSFGTFQQPLQPGCPRVPAY